MRQIEPELTVDSAGTSDWHIGDPPYEPMIRAARQRGVDLTDLRARMLEPKDFDRFDLIVVMDRKNAARAEALRPRASTTPVTLLASYGHGPETEIPDPYYTRDFGGALDLIEGGCRGLRAALRDDV